MDACERCGFEVESDEVAGGCAGCEEAHALGLGDVVALYLPLPGGIDDELRAELGEQEPVPAVGWAGSITELAVMVVGVGVTEQGPVMLSGACPRYPSVPPEKWSTLERPEWAPLWSVEVPAIPDDDDDPDE